MGTLRILLITVLPVLLAIVVGIAVGKYQVKKAAGQLRSLLSPREKIIYTASVVLGVALLLVGIFYQPRPPVPDYWDTPWQEEMVQDDMMMRDEMMRDWDDDFYGQDYRQGEVDGDGMVDFFSPSGDIGEDAYQEEAIIYRDDINGYEDAYHDEVEAELQLAEPQGSVSPPAPDRRPATPAPSAPARQPATPAPRRVG